MLVLSRRQGETIWIGDRVRVTILKMDHNGVRLGIEAPGDVGVLREELIRPRTERDAGTVPVVAGTVRR